MQEETQKHPVPVLALRCAALAVLLGMLLLAAVPARAAGVPAAGGGVRTLIPIGLSLIHI